MFQINISFRQVNMANANLVGAPPEALSQDGSNPTVDRPDDGQESPLPTVARTPSPSRARLQIKRAKFLSSSSLKKRLMKVTHCKFCVRNRDTRSQLEAHLMDSELCKSLYMRLYRVNSLNGVLLNMFKCLGEVFKTNGARVTLHWEGRH